MGAIERIAAPLSSFILASGGAADLVWPNRTVRVRPHRSAPLPFVDVVVPPALDHRTGSSKPTEFFDLTWPRGVSAHAIDALLRFAGITTPPIEINAVEIQANDFRPAPRLYAEREIQVALVRRLRDSGQRVRSEVRCDGGRADVVTDSTIYEIKTALSRTEIIKAVGQVMVYRAVLGTHLKPAIVGRFVEGTQPLLDSVQDSGVQVILWPPAWLHAD